MGSWWGGDTFLSHRRDKNGYPRAYRRRRRFRSSASRVPSRCPQSSAWDRCRHEPDRRIPLIRLSDKTSRLQLRHVVSRPAQASSAAIVVETHNVGCSPPPIESEFRPRECSSGDVISIVQHGVAYQRRRFCPPTTVADET